MVEHPGHRPRKDLFSNGDLDAWLEQFHLLRYMLHMSSLQVAQIDYGLDPDHPDAWMGMVWAHEIDREYPRVDVKAMIRQARLSR